MAQPPTLHVLETAKDLREWQSRYTPQITDTVVALSAEAMDALTEAGIAHRTIEDFYSEADLMAVAEGGNEVVKRLCATLDEQAGISFDQDLPEFSTRYYAGRLRVLYDTFLRAAFVLTAALDDIQPGLVICALGPTPDPSNIWVEDPRFLTWVLKEACDQRSIPLQAFPSAQPELIRPKGLGTAFKDLLRRGRDALHTLLPGQTDIAYYYWPDRPDDELAQNGLRLLRLPAAWPVTTTSAAVNTANAEALFNFSGLELGALARPHMTYLLNEFRARHVVCLQRYEKCLANSGASAVVATAALTIEAVAAMLAGRRADLPAVVLQHGGFIGYCDWRMLPFIDLNLNDHYLVYGAGVRQSLEPLAREEIVPRKHPITFYETGSVNVAAILKARSPQISDKPRVLYITTYLCGSHRYLAGHHRPDIAYLKMQREVLRTLTCHSDDWDVHYRPPPHYEKAHIGANIPDHDLERVTIHTEGSLMSLLQSTKFDLIVTDAVATVLLEALATNARIVTWFDEDVMSLKPEAAEMLGKRADVALSETQYLDLIEVALNEKHLAQETDDSFLMHYALCGTGSPATQQVQTLRKIINAANA